MKPRFLSVISTLLLVGCPHFPIGDGEAPPARREPDTRPVVRAAFAPPPISGGTLLVSRDQRTAIASDPDHDVVWRVDLRTSDARTAESPVLSATALGPGDEPGRLVEDQRGWIHVALRRGGAVATIDPAHAQDVTRRAVCPEPRGIAYEARTDVLHVACTNGDLVTLPAAGGGEVRRVRLDDDLRDVVLRSGPQGDTLVVSRFRSAELLELGADGSIARRIVPPSTQRSFEDDGAIEGVDRAPAVAWRTIASSAGALHVVHQRMQDTEIRTERPAAYGGGGGGCSDGILDTVSTIVEPGDSTAHTSDFHAGAVLAVDVAVSRDDGQVALASAGTRSVLVEQPRWIGPGEGRSCFGSAPVMRYPMSDFFLGDTMGRQPVAVAYRENEGYEELLTQVRDPSAIVNLTTGTVTLLPAEAVSDSGHQTFHESASVSGSEELGAGAELACASCHPEGREDGRTWTFEDAGARRTQTTAGGVLATAPFHWNGDIGHLGVIMDEVFVDRMSGAEPGPLRVSALASWLDTVPAPQAGRFDDEDAIERGRTLFEDEAVACATCHSGSTMTNNRTVDVGTGGRFQVPSLVGVSARAPYLHDGRGATLRDGVLADDRGGDHGVTSGLSPEQIDDLVAYLGTL